jgi:DNA-directed RNA polymerase subunit K/omega
MPGTPRREQWLERTENARRAARFKFAAQRVRKIADGDPPLTDEQRAELATILTQARESA